MRLKLVRFFLVVFCILVYIFSLKEVYSYKVQAVNKNNKNYSFNRTIVDSNYENNNSKENNVEKEIADIIVPKIGINRKLYSINSKKNTVEKNIQIIESSSMPDVKNGNLILAAHSGDSKISYFHNLNKLEKNDEIIIVYDNIDYRYLVSDKYTVLKTGKVSIKRDRNKNTVTLITCKGENEQLVVIGYLDK